MFKGNLGGMVQKHCEVGRYPVNSVETFFSLELIIWQESSCEGIHFARQRGRNICSHLHHSFMNLMPWSVKTGTLYTINHNHINQAKLMMGKGYSTFLEAIIVFKLFFEWFLALFFIQNLPVIVFPVYAIISGMI